MGTIVLSGTVVLVILGFGNHTWWLVAVALLFVYMQYGRGGASASSSGGSGGGSSGASSGGGSGPRPAATGPTAPAGTSRPDGTAGTAASVPWSPAGRRARETARAQRPGAPHRGNHRFRSCSTRRSFVSAAFTRSSRELSRRCPAPGSGAKG